MTDIHVGNGVEDTATKLSNLVTVINAMTPAPDFVLMSGDIAHDGAVAQNFIDVTGALTGLTPPTHEVPGNHDYQAGGLLTNYDLYFPEEHFSVDIGTLTVIGFMTKYSAVGGDNHASIDASELAWIETQLQAVTPGNSIILVSHHPLYDPRHNLEINQSQGGSDLVTLCDTYGVSAHLAGHVHASPFDFKKWFSNIQSLTSSAFWGNPGAVSPYDNGVYSICNVFSNRIEVDVYDAITHERIPQYGVPSYNLAVIEL